MVICSSVGVGIMIMSELDLNEQLAYEKQRADKAEAEIERMKTENKAYEEMLEEESGRKEGEIRKLKEEAILKEKTFKATKIEITQLQTENTALKEQLATASKGADPGQLQSIEKECAALKQRVDEVGRELADEKAKAGLREELHHSQQEKWAKKEKELKEDLEMAKSLAEELKKYNAILNEKLSYYTRPESPQKKPKEEIERADSKKNIRPPKDSFEKDQYELRIRQLEEQCRSLEESLKRYEGLLKESKLKMHALAQENQTLQGKLKSSANNSPSPSPMLPSLSQSSSPLVLKDSYYSSPLVVKEWPISEEDLQHEAGRLSYSCLLLTKQHYISPFLEVYEDKNTVQIYKSTRAGCYQKSMGFYRHKFDLLSFEQDQIIEPIVRSILESQECSHHSVILFGVKKSCKKYLMSKILVRLKDFLIAKLQNSYECEATFLKRSQEEAKNSTDQANDKKGVVEVMNKVIALGYKTEKGRERMHSSSPKKTQSKPKVRYFSFHADQFKLELASSSFTSLSFRPTTTPFALLNHILYSRLPDVLQSSRARQHLILTLNPIVDLYEHCRNTLSTTFCHGPTRQEGGAEWRGSPIREDLNNAARRRFDSIERQHEQSQLRTRKLEEECHYYRARFDELEFRLKGLLNTHSGQTSYLKKSPVTLSYEKLLKFVHAVQARSAQPLPRFSSMALKPSIYIDKDNESVDAL